MSARTDGPAVSPPDVLAHLAGIVQQVTGRPVAEVQLERHFVDDLRIDSLSMVEILEGTSRELGVLIDDGAAKDFVRVSDLVGYLETRLG